MAKSTRVSMRFTALKRCGMAIISVMAAVIVLCFLLDFGRDVLAAQAPSSRKPTLIVALPSNPETTLTNSGR